MLSSIQILWCGMAKLFCTELFCTELFCTELFCTKFRQASWTRSLVIKHSVHQSKMQSLDCADDKHCLWFWRVLNPNHTWLLKDPPLTVKVVCHPEPLNPPLRSQISHFTCSVTTLASSHHMALISLLLILRWAFPSAASLRFPSFSQPQFYPGCQREVILKSAIIRNWTDAKSLFQARILLLSRRNASKLIIPRWLPHTPGYLSTWLPFTEDQRHLRFQVWLSMLMIIRAPEEMSSGNDRQTDS